MPPKRKSAASAPSGSSTPTPRKSKLAREHNITSYEEADIKEAFSLFSVSQSTGPRKQDKKEEVLPTSAVKKAMTALGLSVSPSELGEYISILDPESEGYTTFPNFLAICALKLRSKDDNEEEKRAEIEQGYGLFTGGMEGPITMAHLKRVAALLKVDCSEELLRDMIQEANGGAGVSKGVELDEFADVMKRAGVYR